MRYHNITHDDMLNGMGLRVVLWVSGCEHKCHNCHNKITWDINSGLIFDEEAKKEIFTELEKDYIKGITFSGGDPLHKKNREEIFNLIKEIKNKFPKKDIWLYTGYIWEEINNLDVIKYIDILVDGRFIEELANTNLEWRGSSNQRVIDVQKSLLENKIINYC
ncbi:anaerobic ribonucleoside-triphosphate reductase activating protein [[Clostridium] colinum]|uniref:anaerobic ribonucleoside-triphosphate reductase activating protein n=1 Tax=[Clostridium] colinum TaxID=36835 RepID=UPI00202523C5|nr:anaerobic ribonucleoside-triphosphate reductase activating protein [[Clostridium] colinum]